MPCLAKLKICTSTYGAELVFPWRSGEKLGHVSEIVDMFVDIERPNRLTKFMDILSLNFPSTHTKLRDTRASDLGQWFLDSKEFSSWYPDSAGCSGQRLETCTVLPPRITYGSGHRLRKNFKNGGPVFLKIKDLHFWENEEALSSNILRFRCFWWMQPISSRTYDEFRSGSPVDSTSTGHLWTRSGTNRRKIWQFSQNKKQICVCMSNRYLQTQKAQAWHWRQVLNWANTA